MRRSQILLASAKGVHPRQIAQQVGCSAQTVRNVIRAFEQKGLGCLEAESSRPKTVHPTFDEAKREQLRQLLHQSPREFGKTRTTWTLGLLAEVCQAQGITDQQVSRVTVHQTLKAMGIDWKRAKTHITSPDPQYELKKRQRDRLIERVNVKGGDWIISMKSGGLALPSPRSKFGVKIQCSNSNREVPIKRIENPKQSLVMESGSKR